ncbi:MAG: sulfotransferase domain-containing protein [Candidatus Thermoplasmatota archaeon]|nr:sulfotransferase domain-containing protein [Candidatus Thermoplasmatota archaeon]
MTLDSSINYIVSGLERSGTSMLMQILGAAGIPISYDKSRLPDTGNPRGYFELDGGKIINKLIDNNFPFDKYRGKFLKITSYGLKFLPKGNYKIIYSERNIDEILDSMEKIARINDKDRFRTKKAFINLNTYIKGQMRTRTDIYYLIVNYNNLLANPEKHLKKIQEFLQLPEKTIFKMASAIDPKLYRQRK